MHNSGTFGEATEEQIILLLSLLDCFDEGDIFILHDWAKGNPFTFGNEGAIKSISERYEKRNCK